MNKLPTLSVEISAVVGQSNIEAYKDAAESIVNGMNEELVTNEDFVQASDNIKLCKKIESAGNDATDSIHNQCTNLSVVLSSLTDIIRYARAKRLLLDKKLKLKKEEIKESVAKAALSEASKQVESFWGNSPDSEFKMPLMEFSAKVDMSPVRKGMSGKKTVEGLEDGAEQGLAEIVGWLHDSGEMILRNYSLSREKEALDFVERKSREALVSEVKAEPTPDPELEPESRKEEHARSSIHEHEEAMACVSEIIRFGYDMEDIRSAYEALTVPF